MAASPPLARRRSSHLFSFCSIFCRRLLLGDDRGMMPSREAAHAGHGEPDDLPHADHNRIVGATADRRALRRPCLSPARRSIRERRKYKFAEQSHATGNIGQCAPLRCPRPDPRRSPLSVACGPRQPAMPDARRQGERRPARQSQRLETWRLLRRDEGHRPLSAHHLHGGEARPQDHLADGMDSPPARHQPAEPGMARRPHPPRFGGATPYTRKNPFAGPPAKRPPIRSKARPGRAG